MNRGLFIAVFCGPTGQSYLDNTGMGFMKCTSIDNYEQKREARNFLIRSGASQIYWFNEYPEAIANNPKAVDYVQQYGFLVYSEKEEI